MPKTFRVTTYELKTGDFTSTSYTLNLQQDLEENYFVMINGSSYDSGDANSDGPATNLCRVSEDPFATGDLSSSKSNSVIKLVRGSSLSDWLGTVTVVECLSDSLNSGFRLIDVKVLTIEGNNDQGSSGPIIMPEGSSSGQAVPFGGFRGGGGSCGSTADGNYPNVGGTFTVSGDPLAVSWIRDITGAGSGVDATMTVYVVLWGSEWTVQNVEVSGTSGGDGANVTGEYDTESISSVDRDNTFVWTCVRSDSAGIGNGWQAAIATLGDGVNQNASETSVAVGGEYNDSRVSICYIMEHPSLAVDYLFKADGDGGSTSYDHTVDSKLGTENYTTANGMDITEGYRFGLQYNTCNGTGNAFPRPLFSTRHTADTTLNVYRNRDDQWWTSWIQSVDMYNIEYTESSPRRVIICS